MQGFHKTKTHLSSPDSIHLLHLNSDFPFALPPFPSFIPSSLELLTDTVARCSFQGKGVNASASLAPVAPPSRAEASRSNIRAKGLSMCVPDTEGRAQCQIQIPLGIEGLWVRILRKGEGDRDEYGRISVLRW